MPELASNSDASTDAQMPRPDSDASVNPLALGRDDRNRVVITDAYTACTAHHECLLVATSCDGCCAQGAIADGMHDAYEASFPGACEGIANDGCPCDQALMAPACRDGHCIALDSFDHCYSPTENLDLAYLGDARGCECDTLDQSLCTGGAALICSVYGIGPTQRWTAVEDGPCGEP